MCQISMDCPPVNWEFFDSVTRKREEGELFALINIVVVACMSFMELLKLAWKLQIGMLKKFALCILHFP